ncbi:enoyl-CoA hydratase/isomerase family protein [Falsiroseomonas oryzae]|uniref:enoyl-CoA hydratase/isomerase family protein n=1 Tax=Falsiroseomonas oryzae TaxID=2766473 RepID=UPI0022EB9380|nr:enoyl-CoA hydratase/isomerase family protein [Roseomonas sp. MO-31]
MADILHETRGAVAWTTLNRPQARNAMTFAMYEGLFERAKAIADDPAIRAWVITGAGGKAFAAGTDISQFTEFRTGQDALDYETRIDRVLSAIEDCPKPVIAAIAGACTGGGLGIAGVCDLRIAAANARFGLPIARTLGNCLSMANYGRFAALIGAARVKELVFTARLVEAEEALKLGLVTELLETPEALETRAMELATHIAGLAPRTLTATKFALKRLRLAAGTIHGDDLVTMCFGSEDFQEGVRAFLGKRPPNWTGR